jgi:hypothetical protein
MSVNINPQPLANKWNVCTPAQTFSAPSREEQIATLRDTLNSPSTPDSVKPSIESAIVKIEYRPRHREVIR